MSLQEVLDHSPIALAIVENLNFISRLSLVRVIPNLRKKIQAQLDFRRIVKWELTKLCKDGASAEAILNSMQYADSWMSGSFVAKCLTGLDFEVGDIDFFTNKYDLYTKKYDSSHSVKYDHVSRFSLSLYKSEILDKIQAHWVIPGIELVVRKQKCCEDESQHSKAIVSIRNFYHATLKLQDIIINKKYPVADYIREIFDMSFLTNIYNGQTLRIFDPEAVLKQTATVNMFQSYFKSFKHVMAYEMTDIEVKSGYMYQQYRRIKKYKDRGFNITIDFSKDIKAVERICQKWGDENYKLTDKDLGAWMYVVNEESIPNLEESEEMEDDEDTLEVSSE